MSVSSISVNQFDDLLRRFCVVHGGEFSDLLKAKAVSHDDRYYFRLRDIHAFMRSKIKRTVSRGMLTRLLRARLGEHVLLNVGGKAVNAWWIPR